MKKTISQNDFAKLCNARGVCKNQQFVVNAHPQELCHHFSEPSV